MAKLRAYVETTIPSFYHEVRTSPDIVARRDWTRQWWKEAPDRYELVTSPAVLDELAGGLPERGAIRLDLVQDLPLLPIEPAIAEIVQAYIGYKLMPADHSSSLEIAMKEINSDPVIDEIREVRHRISARFDHNPSKLVAHYIEMQKQYKDRLIKAETGSEHAGLKPT